MRNQAVYIHIPFCQTICSYCDFCKLYYRKEWVGPYLTALKQEVLTYFPKDKIKTIYIGGGTPSVLSKEELEQLLQITDLFSRDSLYEFTFECNIEQMTEEKLKLLKNHGVNRISYGIQTFHQTHLKELNRKHHRKQVIDLIALTKNYIPNINVDLMYAFETETLEELTEDLACFLELDVPHISTYSLIIEPNTVFGNQKKKAIDDDMDANMYEQICQTLAQHGYQHYEVSNFAKPGFQSRHNLTYWDNRYYYGYGLGASGYHEKIRYTNTRSLNHYNNGAYRLLEHQVTDQEAMENELMLGLRKCQGVSKKQFQARYHLKMEEVFPIQQLIKEGKLAVQGDYIRITPAYFYLSNEVLVSFIGEE